MDEYQNESEWFDRVGQAIQKASESFRRMKDAFGNTAGERFKRVPQPKKEGTHPGSKNHSQKRNKSRAVLSRRSRRINGKYGKGLKKR